MCVYILIYVCMCVYVYMGIGYPLTAFTSTCANETSAFETVLGRGTRLQYTSGMCQCASVPVCQCASVPVCMKLLIVIIRAGW